MLGGAAIGEPFHELLSVLFVTEVESAFDDNGVVVSGIARFSAEVAANPPVYTPPATISWQGALAVDHNTVRTPGAYWDFADIAITFRLSIPRQSSPAADAVLASGLGDPGVQNLLSSLGQGQRLPAHPPPTPQAQCSTSTCSWTRPRSICRSSPARNCCRTDAWHRTPERPKSPL
ncbi:hypothetical protein ACFQX6_12605 [Streptosporangium lutulentum]